MQVWDVTFGSHISLRIVLEAGVALEASGVCSVFCLFSPFLSFPPTRMVCGRVHAVEMATLNHGNWKASKMVVPIVEMMAGLINKDDEEDSKEKAYSFFLLDFETLSSTPDHSPEEEKRLVP